MSFHLAATTAKAIKVIPVMAAALAFSLLPSAPEAQAQGAFYQILGPAPTTGTYYPTQWDLPDLKMETISFWEPHGIDDNGIYRGITLAVRNDGRVQSPATQIRVQYQGRSQTLSVGPIAVNGRGFASTVVYHEFYAPGCLLVATVDPGKVISELNESNNVNTKPHPDSAC